MISLFLEFLKNYHADLLVLLFAFLSGIMLLLENRIGWIIAVCISMFIPFSFLINQYFNSDIAKAPYYMFFGICGLFLTIFGLLISKPIRLNYFPNRITWISIAVIFILLVADKIAVEHSNGLNTNQSLIEIRKQYELDSVRKHMQMPDSSNR